MPPATPANTATPVVAAPVAPTNGAAPAVKADAGPEYLGEYKVSGEVKKYTRADAERALSKVGFADKTVSQLREEAKKIAEERARLKEQEGIWDDDEKLEKKLRELGKLDKLARKTLASKVEDAELTAEQKEVRAEKARADALQKEKDDRDASDRAARQERATQVLAGRLQAELKEAAKRADFTFDTEGFHAVWETVKEWKRLGLPFDADRIIESAREDVDNAFKRLEQSTTKNLKGAALKARLGPAVWKEVLRYAVEELRGGGAPKPPAVLPTRPAETPSDYLSPAELEAKYRSRR